MKNSTSFLIFVAIALLSVLIANSSTANANAGTNLLYDPGFDTSTNPGGFPNSGCWHPDWIGTAGAVLDGNHYRLCASGTGTR